MKALLSPIILIMQGINKIRDKPPHMGGFPIKTAFVSASPGSQGAVLLSPIGGQTKNGHKPVKKLSEWGHYSFPQCQIGLLSGILWRNPEAVSRCPEFVLWIRWHPPISMKTLWAAH